MLLINNLKDKNQRILDNKKESLNLIIIAMK